MADDIDIEEHDLLQNPTIQQIFPDLSILKQEMMDFDEGFPGETTNIKKTADNILSNEVEATDNINIPGISIKSDCAPTFNRKIILGSKPSEGKNNLTLLSGIKVVLQNISPSLLRSKRFCEKCLILFPNKGSLNSHKLSIHTNWRYNNSKHDESLYSGYKKSKCSLCQKEFKNIFTLRQHKKIIHNVDKQSKKITTDPIADSQMDYTFDLQTNYVVRKACFHCNKLFPNEQDLIDHLYTVLYAKKAHAEHFDNKKRVEELIYKNNEIFRKYMCSDVEIEKSRNFSESNSFYSCPICSYCFMEENICKSHVIVKHNVLKNMQIEKSPFDPKCKFCDITNYDVLSYNTHLRKSHKNETIKSIDNVVASHSHEENNCYTNNLPVPEGCNEDKKPKHGNLVATIQNSKIQAKSILKTQINSQIMVSKIILFKCSECNINFLTSDAAFKHTEHLLFQINWECTNCHRLFKVNDAEIHQKQHKCSQYFVVLKVHPDVQPTVLYKCPMCAVHFSKEKISEHCRICESEKCRSTDLSYCKVCDIFLETSTKTSHDNDHNLRNLLPSDIKIIDFESAFTRYDIKSHRKNCLENSQKIERDVPNAMLFDLDISNNIKIKKNCKNLTTISSEKKQLTYNFCNTCKCNICRVFKTNVHRKSLCVNIVKYICKFCGLIFSNKSITSHKKLHQQYKTLKLQDLTFYNLQSKKVMKPPIPEFPKCELCEKHFISKSEVKGHLCDINDYFICSICKIKFSETAYKLHMPFHSYKLNYKNTLSNEHSKIKSCEDRNEINSYSSYRDEIIPIYTCQNCNVSLNTYDNVIEHCHLHTNLNKVEVNCVECDICQLKFVNSSFSKHEELHIHLEDKKFMRFNFDVLYFGSDKWLKHIYKSLSTYEVNKLIGDSIYKYETRIEMGVIQEGPSNLMLYKCEKCQCIIDGNSTYSHIVTCCPNSEVSDCTFCELSFACSVNRNNHEKIHLNPEITLKSFRIIMFNREQDRHINNNISSFKKCYVLYECRFCHVLVEKYNYVYHICFRNDSKKCNICGLLLCTENLNDHILKHKMIQSFNVNKIKVVLIGNKTEENDILQGHNILLPTFSGIVCDYTFYKCIDCEVCVRDVRNTTNHSCLIDAAKSQCTKCDLIFDEGKLKGHLKLHDTDPDFTKETILVKSFINQHKKSKNAYQPTKLLPVDIENNEQTYNEKNKHNVRDVVNFKKAILYKCWCGLHCLNQPSSEEHMQKCSGKNKSKQSIHNCSKCGLSFTSDILFKHLLEHHGDRNIVYKYEIIQIPVNCTVDNNT